MACDLAVRGVVRDDDVRVDAERAGRVGDGLGVVAGRMREHPARPTAGSSREIAVTAPRILNAPIGCRFSGLSHSPGHGEASSGVRTAYGRISVAASWIRSRVTRCGSTAAHVAPGCLGMLGRTRRGPMRQPRRIWLKARRSIADSGVTSGSSRASSGSMAASTPPASSGVPASTARLTRASAIGPCSWCCATVPSRPTTRPCAGGHRVAGLRQGAGRSVQIQHDQPARRPAEVVHPGDGLLAPVAALLQVDRGAAATDLVRNGPVVGVHAPRGRRVGMRSASAAQLPAGRRRAGQQGGRPGRSSARGTSRSMPSSVRRVKPPSGQAPRARYPDR